MALVDESVRPADSIVDNLYNVYRHLARHGIVEDAESAIVSAWLEDVAAIDGI